KQKFDDGFQQKKQSLNQKWAAWKDKLYDGFQNFRIHRKQSASILWQLIVQSIPTFFIIWFFTYNARFALILTAIFVLVNFFRIQKANRPMRVKSQFFPGDLSSVQYYLAVTFYVLGVMSKSKGRVTQNDIKYAESLMDQFQVTSSTRQILMKVFNQGRDGTYNINEVIAEFCQIFRNRGQSLNYFFEYQLNAAMQDGRLQAEELSILQTIAAYMGMSAATFQQKVRSAEASYRAKSFYSFYQQASSGQRDYSYQGQNRSSGYGSSGGYGSYGGSSSGGYGSYGGGRGYGGYQSQSSQSQLRDAYDILGVKEKDDFDTVKKAYRKLIKQYHPDKYVSQDVPEAVKEQANQKSQQIISAYNLICKTKDWK
ncbi:MAG: co-chaperone DjlA, partial [Neisseriaceae bacterium]|nr:co-chaperone DjlA [Neisseriaceae bacterium]